MSKVGTLVFPLVSPSMRREWIEIKFGNPERNSGMSPSMRREWIEIAYTAWTGEPWRCLPPCGGSGLKYFRYVEALSGYGSPSMRREWIEISKPLNGCALTHVSLHAEGVD